MTITAPTTTATDPPEPDRFVIVPEFSIPSTVPAAIAEATTKLNAIADQIEDLAEFIGVNISQHMVATNAGLAERGTDPYWLTETPFGAIGWTPLEHRLTQLGEALLAAAGHENAIYDAPDWSSDIASAWGQARAAFENGEVTA